MAEMLAIMNAALLAQGQDEIVSETSGLDEFRILSRNWPIIVEAELEAGLYEFARKDATLLNREEGHFGYEWAYRVPGDALHVRHVKVQTAGALYPVMDWSQDGAHVHCDEESGIWIEYVTTPRTDLWSANFTRGVQCELEAIIARAIREEPGEASDMEMKAARHFETARTRASQGRAPREPYSGPTRFLDARRGRGSRGAR